jgi:integrase/recombinase XerD
VIQEISGHNNLEQLQKYLEVKPEQVRGAVAALSMLSHEGGSNIEIFQHPELDTTQSIFPDIFE